MPGDMRSPQQQPLFEMSYNSLLGAAYWIPLNPHHPALVTLLLIAFSLMASTRTMPLQVSSDPRFEVAAPPRFGLTCFRLKGADNDTNKQLVQRINADGELLSPWV